MKKFLVSVLLCVGIVSSVSPMKRKTLRKGVTQDLIVLEPVGLKDLFETCPDVFNFIACLLNGESFSALIQACKTFQIACDKIPVINLGFNFSDVAPAKSAKYIDRFMACADEWMFQNEIDYDSVVVQGNGENSAIQGFDYALNDGLQGFFGNNSICCICKNDEIVRYVFILGSIDSPDGKPVYTLYFNVKETDEATHEASRTYMRECSKFVIADMFAEVARGSLVCGTRKPILPGLQGFFDISARYCNYSIPDTSSHFAESLSKIFVMISTFILAVVNKDLHVVYAILNNPKSLEYLPTKILEFAVFDQNNGYEITDIVSVILSQRATAELNAIK